jgi:hypothetical protein
MTAEFTQLRGRSHKRVDVVDVQATIESAHIRGNIRRAAALLQSVR